MIIGNISGGIAYYSSNSSLIDTTNTPTTNINNNDLFTIYPNPTNDSFTISSNKSGIVRIKNLLGNTVLLTRKFNQELKISTANLSKGIYMVELDQLIKKLVVK